ncbi:hypothetical protein [Streptomyces chartreusis]|uniref:hypothetical protein n=1 Tax=Streptomyces chartreusis TaxID=1969 RepID=UPI0033C888B9
MAEYSLVDNAIAKLLEWEVLIEPRQEDDSWDEARHGSRSELVDSCIYALQIELQLDYADCRMIAEEACRYETLYARGVTGELNSQVVRAVREVYTPPEEFFAEFRANYEQQDAPPTLEEVGTEGEELLTAAHEEIDATNTLALKNCEEGNWLPALFVPAECISDHPVLRERFEARNLLVIGEENKYNASAQELGRTIPVLTGRVGLRRTGSLRSRLARGKMTSAGELVIEGFDAPHADPVRALLARISRKEVTVADEAIDSMPGRPAGGEVKKTEMRHTKANIEIEFSLGGVECKFNVSTLEEAEEYFRSWGLPHGPIPNAPLSELLKDRRRAEYRIEEATHNGLKFSVGTTNGRGRRRAGGINIFIKIEMENLSDSGPRNSDVFLRLARGEKCRYVQIGNLVRLYEIVDQENPEMKVLRFAANIHYRQGREAWGLVKKLRFDSALVLPFPGADTNDFRTAMSAIAVEKVRFSSGRGEAYRKRQYEDI